MALRLITAPAAMPITLAEARAHCTVDGTDHDTVLEIAITGATDDCQGRLRRKLITQTWEQVLDAFPSGAIDLGLPSVQSIASVQYVPVGGTALGTLDPAAYTLDNIAESAPHWALPIAGWPDTADVANAVRVRFVTGFGASGAEVPGALRSWLLLAIGALFENRSAIDVTGRATALPDGFHHRLLDQYIVY